MKNFIKLGLLSLILTGCTFVIEPEESEEEYAVYHLVEFDSVYGNKVESQNVKHGEKVTKPKDPVGEGYIFVEWQYNNKAWRFDEDVVTKDITLTAKWDRGEFYLRLINSDPTKGTIKASGFREEVVDGETLYFATYNEFVSISATPFEGCAFDGWYDENDNLRTDNEKLTFTKGIDETLVAKWL